MKNEKRNSNNDTERRSATSSSLTGQSTTDGGNIRANDGNEPPVSRQSESIGFENRNANEHSPSESRGNQKLVLQDGYYFTPSGNVERVPDGHYIDNGGRLRKRRQSRSDSGISSDGNEDRDRTETSDTEKFSSEIPLRTVSVRGRKSKEKKITESQQRMTMIAMLSVACSATFTSIALLTKHRHWSLESEEVKPMAEALNDAFATLPSKAYETILAVIEKWVPWVNLVFVCSAIIIPRIEESVKQYESSRYRTDNGSDKRTARAENNPFPNEASFGFNE
jgi:hypothetical protein